MKIGLLGFGTVGSAFYTMARDCADVEVCSLLVLQPVAQAACRQTTRFDDVVQDPQIDTVVELIGGLHPAYEYVSAALKAGKHVVTANKWLLCEHYDELVELACKHGAALRCTAAAGGGIPWLHALTRLRACDRIGAVSGIMNGTTNYILSAMTQQETEYEACLREAQRLGYAEADPTADVEGLDARRKLVLSANIAFGVSIRESQVPCLGITGITGQDIAAFKRLGLVCKLVAHARAGEKGISACVEPMLIPADSQLAHVNGADNLISLSAERVGRQSFSGAGAGGFATASNVLADCLEIAGGSPSFYTQERRPAQVANDGRLQRYYVRTAEGTGFEPLSIQAAHTLANKLKKKNLPFFMAAVSEEDKC